MITHGADLEPTPIERVLSPFLRFARLETAGGLLLIVCAAIAIVVANSPWAETYHHFWEIELGLTLGPITLALSLHHFINDGLMVIFFFLVGLEIKREMMVGELASARRAALPAAAALGGMLVPAGLYLLLNIGTTGVRGWGIPMATDIAFALGVLMMLGPAIPIGLKVFLTALAIVDDIGAVLVIALFYTEQIVWWALWTGFGVLAVAALSNRLRIRSPFVYMIIGVVLWFCFLVSGVHATVAGVLLALTIPASTRIDQDEFVSRSRGALDAFTSARQANASVVSNPQQQEAIHQLEQYAEAAQAPLQRIEHVLHGVVIFGIIPLFALANAGVTLQGNIGDAFANRVTLGIILGLVLGKPIGIVLFSWLAVKLKIAELPHAVSWSGIHAVSWLGGIGFTMSLFVTTLAFVDARVIDQAKFGILSASIVAGVIGGILLWRLYVRRRPTPRRTEVGAE
ncbi:MAG: Na+/H+ antiporter NhaA [Gemmatimonadota bacterium]